MSYDFDWHKQHGEMTSSSARQALGLLRSALPFASALDVGCGDGRWLATCRDLGVADIHGVDGPWTNLSDILIPADVVTIADLSGAIDLGRKFDLAISLEVAEHVPEASAGTFVDNLVRHGDLVLFGAAIPYQGGYRHINERWPSYWQALFDSRGYEAFDLLRGALWARPDVHYWYKQNMLVYVKRDRQDLMDAVQAHLRGSGVVQLPVDIVYPAKYEAIASYAEIAFKPLMRQLPARALAKLAAMAGGKT